MATVPPNRTRVSVVYGEVCTSLLYMPHELFTKLPTNGVVLNFRLYGVLRSSSLSLTALLPCVQTLRRGACRGTRGVGMRRVVLVLATMALAILVAGGVAQAIEIEKDRPAYVSFDPTYKSGSSRLTKGTPYLHPKYCIPTPEDKVDCSPEVPTEALVLRELRYDVGVVVLEEPVKMATYGALPEAGLVDTLKEGQRLTIVG